MKKIIFVSLLVMCTSLTIKAQWNGGSPETTETDVVIGNTTSTRYLRIKGTAEGPTTSASVINGTFRMLCNTANMATMFGATNSPHTYSWIQTKDLDYNTYYPLSLNPLGGNVGVGLTNPASKLHSAGQISTGIPLGGLGGASATNGSLLFYNSSNSNTINIQSGATTPSSYTWTLPLAQGGASEVLTNDGSGNLSWSNPNTGITNMAWLLTGNSGTMSSTAAIGSTVNNNFIGTIDQKDFVLATYNLERMRVTSVGNVGIGLTAPITKLEVLPSTTNSSIKTGSLELQSYAVNDGWIGDNIYYNAGYKYRANGYANIIQFGSGNIYFRSDVSGSAGGTANMATKMIILNGGDVGIGTITPSYRLDVSKAGGTAATVDVARIYASAPSQASARLKFGTTANPSTLADITAKTITSTTGILSFSTSGNVSTTIDTAGNVGIGTTSPTYKLDVNGKIRTRNDTAYKPNAGSWTGISDQRLKQNIASFEDGLDVLLKVNPKTYQFNGIGDLPTKKTYIGVIAQEILPIAPYCVSVGTAKLKVKESDAQNFSGAEIIETLPPDSTGVVYSIISPLTYNYDGLIYVMINSIKQLDSINTGRGAEIQTLRDKINQLETTINSCCNSGSTK